MKKKYSFFNFFKLLFLFQNIYFSNSEIDNIIRIGDETYIYFQFSTNTNGDMVIDLSSDSSNSAVYAVRRFYGLKKNGRYYFNKDNVDTPYFTLTSTITSYKKINSVSYFIQLSTDNFGKECIFSLSKGSSTVDIYDLDNEEITTSLSLVFSRKNIKSIVNTLFKSKYQPDQNYFYYILAYSTNQNPDKFLVRKEYFESTTIQQIHDSNYNGPTCTNNNIVSCFETSEYNIVCLFQNSNYQLEIYGYSQTSDQGTTEDTLVDTTIGSEAEIFFKCIHYKDEIGVFIYYLSESSTYPIISFKQYTPGTGASSYKNYFDLIELNKKTDFNPGTLLNDIIKLSDDKICIASASSSKNLLYLVILNLFEDDTKMLISYFSVNLMELNHNIYNNIKLYLYNNFITFGFNHCLTSSCGDTDAHYSSMIIFNYPNISSSETNLDLIEYLSKNNNDIGSLNINLAENIVIQNNIFGYETSSTKIMSISENLNVYYKTNKTTILENYIIPTDAFIKISLDESSYTNGKTYSIEYAQIAKSSTFGNYITNAEDYDFINFNGINEVEEYYSENEYIGKSLYYSININTEDTLSSDGCTTEQCLLCYSSNKEKCVACNDGYYYSESESKCIVKPDEENIVQTTIISTEISTILTTTIELIPTTIINEIVPSTIPKEIIETTIPKEIIITTIPKEIIETTIPKEIIITTIPKEIIITTIPKEIIITTIPEEIIETTIPKEIIITTIPKETIITTISKDSDKITSDTEIIAATIPKEIITTTISKEKITTTIPENDEIATETKEIATLLEEIKCSPEDIYKNNCTNNIQSEQIQEIYSDIKDKIMHGQYNSSNNTIYKTKNIVFQISTIKEQQNSNNNNISSIDFEECEKKIKEKYEIDENDDLIIFKTDMHSDNSSAIYVQYEIYNPKNLNPIPLDVCEDVTISINIPVLLDEGTESLYMRLSKSGYNLFDSNDSFYNDICKTYTTENGTDITLADRKSLIYDNNKDVYLCQEGCSFTSYNETTKKSKCNCDVQKNIINTDIKKIKFDKKEFVMSSLKNSNFRVIKCYKLIFSKKGELNNYGSYILIGIIIILIISMFCYCFIGNKKLNEFVQTVIKQKFNFNNINVTDKKENYIKQKTKINLNNKQNKKGNTKKNNSKKKENKKITNKNGKKNINKKNKKDSSFPPKKRDTSKEKKIKSKNQTSLIDIKKDSTSRRMNHLKNLNLNKKNNNKINKSNKNEKNKKNEEIPNVKVLNDEELNSLTYKQALIIDKRTYFQYYYSLIKKKHLILFTFLPNNDYNLIFIKISLLLLSFSLYFTVNAFFFTDSTMHKITEDHGDFDFLYQIPQIFYSTVISAVINMILKKLSLSELQILSIKQEKELDAALKKGKEILNCLKIKFIIFFILSFIFCSLFWYFIACFCAVYKNTQIILIKNTLLSFGLSMIYPFGLNLLPGMLRIPALRDPKKDKQCLYKISTLVAII